MRKAVQLKLVDGFEGAITGLRLADLIQLKANNRFTGCIWVEFGKRRGEIYFHEGEIFHAEKGNLRGEEAFHGIMRWPGGRFTVLSQVGSVERTIDRNWRFLLMESHRLMDEIRGVAAETGARGKRREPAGSSSGVAARIRAVPDVTAAIMADSAGNPAGGENTADTRGIAAQAAMLARFGDRLGDLLSLGGTTSALRAAPTGHLFVFSGPDRLLAITARGESSPTTVEAAIRRAAGQTGVRSSESCS